MPRLLAACVLLLSALLVVAACEPAAPEVEISIVSGSENKALEPIIQQWGADNGVAVAVTYLGSVDMSLALGDGRQVPFDAVWPANSLWLELGDRQRVVRHAKSILRSPVVFGVKKSIAERLGWTTDPNVTVQDILAAAQSGAFRFAMTSATQSNSGASAYIGFLYAMAGNPDVLDTAHLNDPAVQERIASLLGRVDRGSGSSGWLKDTLVAHPDRFDAMVNYEAMVIEGNRQLVRAGNEPLCAIYPVNGLMVADSPLGYVDKGDAKKEAAFLALQSHLLSPEVQQEIEAMGRRTGLLGMQVTSPARDVWNPAWCIDTERAITPVPVPSQAVIREALDLYQTVLRKPSLTVWVLDISGSMKGAGIDALREAMVTLLDPETAKRTLLQPSARDITIVIPFNERVEAAWRVEGNDVTALEALLRKTQSLQAGGGTRLYPALMAAFEALRPYHDQGVLFDYLPAIVAMTDGKSDLDGREELLAAIRTSEWRGDVPIHTIAFGQSDETQLEELSQITIGRLFESHGNLPQTLRTAKGYN